MREGAALMTGIGIGLGAVGGIAGLLLMGAYAAWAVNERWMADAERLTR